jgi:hypothetical protein
MTDPIEQLWAGVNPRIIAMASEARELRAAQQPGEADGPTEVRKRLVDIRRRLDRLEQITADLGRIRARADAMTRNAQDAYDDAYAESARNARPAEFSSARERDAVHVAHALNELIALRWAQRRLAEVAEAYEYAKTLHRGLDGARRDEATLLSAMTVENRLEH